MRKCRNKFIRSGLSIRILLPVILLLPVSGMVLAQKFNGGVLLGLSTSEISGDRVTGPSKAGLYAGLFTSLYVSNHSSLQLELDYVQKGSRENPDSSNNYSSYILRLHYIELHLLYHYDIKRFTCEAGPSLGYMAHSYEEADGWELDDPFNPLDLSIGVGLYYRIFDNLKFCVRYSNSVLPVRNNPSGGTWTLKLGEYNEVLSFTFYLTMLNPEK